MMNRENGPEFDAEIPPRAVSVLPGDGGMDEFPVLKAFQQYIDAEQDKARKRLMFISSMFGIFLALVVGVFVVLLMNVTQRNQALNDRLVDYAMKERERPANSPVVVQQPVDNAALMALTKQLEEMRKNFEAEKNAREQAEKAKEEKAKRPSAQDLEIERLKAQLQIEKDKVAAEREKVAAEKAKVAEEKAKQKEAELEAYRRKHYPELYTPSAKSKRQQLDEVDVLIDDLDDDTAAAISYFEEDEEADRPVRKAKSPARSKSKGGYKIPVETIESQPDPDSRWRIPNL